MKDIQNQTDHRQIKIDRVGIKGIRYPITVLDRSDEFQQTIASINMYVDLPHDMKGTHMSRFVELLHVFREEVSVKSFSYIMDQMKETLNAESARIEVRFPYFIEKKAPISRAAGLMDYQCGFIATSQMDKSVDIVMEVSVPITSVCPCSKEISEYGAHNQRGQVLLRIRFDGLIWLEEMISLVEKCASSELYSILKRMDEKEVTERGYDNPKFVEDIVRDIAVELEKIEKVTWYELSVENFESIHNHSAYAYINSNSTA
ncbi:MAG: GTP cyclohydrolase I FolE2 [Deltaproteobacteria bacterium]|jgi:GTP cyclohydrolase IB|nr:GTP cyclohydrolase I FolE2 [Deltaproteobacteria bacterium]MBT4644585.1 GTP cyclohydrolase I FolE2 [Deltaproteobacteria bacterium]MBT6501583.1 GTP cyclohydrolase I FolE2 [Deltaproteobacteria bacterium]MBT6614018.1 GTP cyclohydrolase I FolE2 [Deltaproteobacteria bacterium]MBT7151144.1 GTP cyclohydrolase I FolE2 [Deltaproteobacteria bacterium]